MRLLSKMAAACLGLLHAAKIAGQRAFSKLAGGVWWLRQLRLHTWLVEGTQRDCGLPLSILCAVSEDEQPYLLKLIFGDSYKRRYLGRYWLWKLARLRPTPSCDFSMIVAETYESHLGVAHLKDWFFIPTWVGGNVALPRDGEATRKVGGDLRRIRQHGLRCEITCDPQQIDDFYYNMYVPYISQTFGDCAAIASYERFQTDVKVSELLLIKDQEGSIAGQLIMHGDEDSNLGMMGIRDGNRDYIKAGAAVPYIIMACSICRKRETARRGSVGRVLFYAMAC